jgi:hypothetical protein
MRRTFPSRLAAPFFALLLVGAAGPERDAMPPAPPKPRSPSGEVLFRDDFSDGLGRWAPESSGAWKVSNGMLRADLPDEKQARAFLYAGSEDWRDYALDYDVCGMRGVDKGAVVRVQGQSGFAVDLRGGSYQDVVAYVREWPVGKSVARNANGAWSHVRIEAKGERYRVFVNGRLVIEAADDQRPQGRIALAAYTGGVGECTAWFDNVVVTKLK